MKLTAPALTLVCLCTVGCADLAVKLPKRSSQVRVPSKELVIRVLKPDNSPALGSSCLISTGIAGQPYQWIQADSNGEMHTIFYESDLDQQLYITSNSAVQKGKWDKLPLTGNCFILLPAHQMPTSPLDVPLKCP